MVLAIPLRRALGWSLSYWDGSGQTPADKAGIGAAGVQKGRPGAVEFPIKTDGTAHVPEDDSLRAPMFCFHYYPSGFFDGQVTNDPERALEKASHAISRAERC